MNDPYKEERYKSMPTNNQPRESYSNKCQTDNMKTWNQMSKHNANMTKESYYNGNEWRYPNGNSSTRFPNNYSSATYYFNNNAYHCVPSYFYCNYQYPYDVNYLYYPTSQFSSYQNYYRGTHFPRHTNRNYRKSRGGKQFVYNIKNNNDFTDDGEYIDDNIIDMEKMKEIETIEDNFTKECVEFSNRCNSPTNEELCQSTSMLLGETTERARGYLNLYNHINYGEHIQP